MSLTFPVSLTKMSDKSKLKETYIEFRFHGSNT